MNPLVSIIIPAYNAAETLLETLESAIRQTYPALEIIVVDDGSTDATLSLAREWTLGHPSCRVYTQPNAGVSAARNHAIRESEGVYILPLDADNIIEPDYVSLAVDVLRTRPEVRVVACRADFFGMRTGEWIQPPFSLTTLARKNIIDACAMYRRADYDRTPGYNESFPYREDWDLWLSLFSLGGEFVRLDRILLHYRVRRGSKRIADRSRKRELVREINIRHRAFLDTHLGGPLHVHRRWSRLLNRFRRESGVGPMPLSSSAEVLYRGRNMLVDAEGVVVKHFAIPSLWRRLIYGLLVPSKARRSYAYALRLEGLTPEPIAYRESRYLGLLGESAYACRRSVCPYTFRDLRERDFTHREQILVAIGRFTALLHQRGVFHADYSEGNILFSDDGSRVEIVDLNRVHFCHHLTWKQRMRNFERLNIDRASLSTIVRAYAEAMRDDADRDIDYVLTHRWAKHVKLGITYLE